MRLLGKYGINLQWEGGTDKRVMAEWFKRETPELLLYILQTVSTFVLCTDFQSILHETSPVIHLPSLGISSLSTGLCVFLKPVDFTQLKFTHYTKCNNDSKTWKAEAVLNNPCYAIVSVACISSTSEMSCDNYLLCLCSFMSAVFVRDSRTLLALLLFWLWLPYMSAPKLDAAMDFLGGCKILLRWSEDSTESTA